MPSFVIRQKIFIIRNLDTGYLGLLKKNMCYTKIKAICSWIRQLPKIMSCKVNTKCNHTVSIVWNRNVNWIEQSSSEQKKIKEKTMYMCSTKQSKLLRMKICCYIVCFLIKTSNPFVTTWSWQGKMNFSTEIVPDIYILTKQLCHLHSSQDLTIHILSLFWAYLHFYQFVRN